MSLTEKIRAKALELGFDICRFTTAEAPASFPHFQQWHEAGRDGEMGYLKRGAEKRSNLGSVLPGARSVVALAVSYHEKESGGEDLDRGFVARYARRADYHNTLAAPLRELATFIDAAGPPGTRSLWYVDTGPILERDLAQRAGIGFVGKHTNVISREFGNWILLAEVISTLGLQPDVAEHNRCGSCARCIVSCPTRAIVAPFQLDARLCISYLTIELKGSIPVELRAQIGNRIFGCDECLAVCPWNRFAREGHLLSSHREMDLQIPVLLRLLELDDASFSRMFNGTPMQRSKRRGLLRNVCVALGNTAGEEALPGLCKAAADAEPLIAEHAAWALDQITSRATSVSNGIATTTAPGRCAGGPEQ